MKPTVLAGDLVYVKKNAYDLRLPLTDFIIAHYKDPRRGDIATFQPPSGGAKMVKRVIGVPGDRIEVRNSRVIINDTPLGYSQSSAVFPEEMNGEILIESISGHPHYILLGGKEEKPNYKSVVVPEKYYFVMGDARDQSVDSRVFGFVPRNLFRGEVRRVIASFRTEGSFSLRTERTLMAPR